MWLQSIFACIFTIDAVIPFLKFKKVIMHICKFVKHIAKTFVFGMGTYFVFIGSHAENSITYLNINLLKKSH